MFSIWFWKSQILNNLFGEPQRKSQDLSQFKKYISTQKQTTKVVHLWTGLNFHKIWVKMQFTDLHHFCSFLVLLLIQWQIKQNASQNRRRRQTASSKQKVKTATTTSNRRRPMLNARVNFTFCFACIFDCVLIYSATQNLHLCTCICNWVEF